MTYNSTLKTEDMTRSKGFQKGRNDNFVMVVVVVVVAVRAVLFVCLAHLSGNSSAEVVSAPGLEEDLVVELNKSGKDQELGLSPSGDSIPSLQSLGGDAAEGQIGGKVSGEVESSANDTPSNEGSHGNTTVLELGVTEPSKSLVRSPFGKTERIPHLAEFSGIRGGKDLGLANAGVRRLNGGRRGLLNNLLGDLLLRHEPSGRDRHDLSSRLDREGHGAASGGSENERRRELHRDGSCLLRLKCISFLVCVCMCVYVCSYCDCALWLCHPARPQAHTQRRNEKPLRPV